MPRRLLLPFLLLAIAGTAACREEDDTAGADGTDATGASESVAAQTDVEIPEIRSDEEPRTAEDAIRESKETSETLPDEVRDTAQQGRQEARDTVAQLVDEIRNDSEMASDELESATDEAERELEAITDEARAGVSDEMADRAGVAPAGDGAPEPEDSLVALLTPESFDQDRLIEEIEASDSLSEIQKMALTEAVRRAEESPEAMVRVLNRVRDALGLDPLE